MPDDIQPFDRTAVRRHRDRAAAGWAAHDFLQVELADRLADRLDDIRRPFERVVDLSCRDGLLSRRLASRAGRGLFVQSDPSPAFPRRAAEGGRPALVADEDLLPFAAGSFDLVLSLLSLHWVNDLPGCLLQIRRCLRPDGLFLGAMLGGETLAALREAFLAAELETTGGAAPRVSPMADLRDAAGLLQRAGFALPVADLDTVEVSYPDPLALLRELRGMGETNALRERPRNALRRDTLMEALASYQQACALPDGRVRASFQVLWLAGWGPDDSQQKPLRPGSAQARLADALGGVERPADSPPSPGRSFE